MTMKDKKVCIVGAGITGCTIARLLAEQGAHIDLIEKTLYIGGACTDTNPSLSDSYHQLHGSHIFHTNNEDVWKFLSRFTKWFPYQHKVKALIDGNLAPVPFNLNSLKSLNDRFVEDIYGSLKSYQYGKEFTLEELTNSNDMTLRALGTYIYENVFKTYSTKQWGKIPKESTLNRVKAFRFSKDDRYFLDKYQGIPAFGFSDMMLSMITHNNIEFSKCTEFNKKLINKYDHVIYTGSIDELFDYEFGELPYRTCRFSVNYSKFNKVQESAVINYTKDYDFTRTHDYSWYTNGAKSSVIATEYPEDFNKNNSFHVRYYPIDTKENRELYMKYRTHALKVYPNMIFAGRLGAYHYYNMDRAVEQAFELVNVLS